MSLAGFSRQSIQSSGIRRPSRLPQPPTSAKGIGEAFTAFHFLPQARVNQAEVMLQQMLQ